MKVEYTSPLLEAFNIQPPLNLLFDLSSDSTSVDGIDWEDNGTGYWQE